MRGLSEIAFVGMVTLTMHGCGFQADTQQSSAATPSAPQVAQQPAEPFTKPPMLPPQPEQSVAITSAPSFIQSTDGDQRAKQVQKGRQDPFAGLFVQTPPNVVTTVVPHRTVVPQRISPVAGKPQKPQRVAVRLSSPSPVVNIGNPGSQPTQDQNKPSLEAPTPSEPVLPPPPPQPDLARAVAVTGVIQVGDEPEAIVKVPNETTSRYVKIGQRLANGQVLVKRIEINEGADPVVILEQYGTEVARAVGEQPVANTAPTNTSSTSANTPPTSANTPPAGDTAPSQPTNSSPAGDTAPPPPPTNSSPAGDTAPPPPTNSSSPGDS